MSMPWREEAWSKGILLGIRPDPNSGYRATVWFEYTRYLFNEIREGSLIAVRNFSDRRRNPDGSPAEDRNAKYEEYSILQIDQVHPWHYAIQGGGEQGYPGFTVASAESARTDWTDMDEENRDDVSRIKCEAIPLRLAFGVGEQRAISGLPDAFFDRSMPMPGFEARILSSNMTRAVLNKNIDHERAFELGKHIVQYDVPISVQRQELTRLHFGVFGYTGAGKSNLVSSLVTNLLSTGPKRPDQGENAFKVILFDLMDEYTGLLIDQLISQTRSQLIVCGRRTLPELVFKACEEVATGSRDASRTANEAAADWCSRLILPTELKRRSGDYASSLAKLILQKKIRFYEPAQQQGLRFDLDTQTLIDGVGKKGYGNTKEDEEISNQRLPTLKSELDNLIESAKKTEGKQRDEFLMQVVRRCEVELNHVTSQKARKAVADFIQEAKKQMNTRASLHRDLSATPRTIARLLNFQPTEPGHSYLPSLTLVVGETDEAIASFARQMIEVSFEDRRARSILYPTLSFVFDEADVFISQQRSDRAKMPANLVDQVTMLARRGRKFGLGVGIATQRVRFLDTSIMAQPHTYFISKLPRKSDREVVAEAFAISDETLEQTFGFTVGQWLVTSHDATGLKGIPFPVQLPNANDRVKQWLDREVAQIGSSSSYSRFGKPADSQQPTFFS